jgi:hypothetical protein
MAAMRSTARQTPSAEAWLRDRIRGPRAVLLGVEPAAVLALAAEGVVVRAVVRDPAALEAALGTEPAHVRDRVTILGAAEEAEPESADAAVVDLGEGDQGDALLAEAVRVTVESGHVALIAPCAAASAAEKEAAVRRLLKPMAERLDVEALDLLDGAVGALARRRASDPARNGGRRAATVGAKALGRELVRELERVADLNALIAELDAGISARDRLTADLDGELQALRRAMTEEALVAELAEVRAALGKARARAAEAAAEAGELRASLDRARKRAERAAQDYEAGLERTGRMLVEARADLAVRDAELAKAHADLAAREAELATREAALAASEAELAAARAALTASEAELAAARDETVAARDETAASRQETVAEAEAATRLRAEVAGLAAEVERLAAVEADLSAATARAQAAEEERDDVLRREQAAGERLAAAERRLADVEAQLERVSDRLALRARQVEELRSGRAYRLSRALWRLRHPRSRGG